MKCNVALIEAIDRLTAAVSQPLTPFESECLSTALTTVGSVAAVLIFELIKNKIFAPRDEFKKLRRKVNSTLIMYARYYSNPANLDRPTMSDRTREDYIVASAEVRKMAVDVISFADERKMKACCGIAVKDIREAGMLLIGLSNSFFSTGDKSERDYTKKRVEDIKRLLGIAKEQ